MLGDFFKKQKGLTLVEMIVSMTILSVVLTLSYTFFNNGIREYHRSVQLIEQKQNVRHALGFIAKKLQNAYEKDVLVKPQSRGDDLIIGQEAYRFVGSTIWVNHQRQNSSSPFNPLVENISEFSVSKKDRQIFISISSGSEQNGDLFSLDTKIHLNR